NTQGTRHPANASLPASKHTNPFLAAYWDDLDTFGDNIRYGVVGTSPDRTYVIDYQVDVDPANEGGSADDIRFQIQIHESSNVINVRYGTSGHIANGQAATIGFQGAGGAGATAFPLTFNGKILDDNRPDEGSSNRAARSVLGLATMSALMPCRPDDIRYGTVGASTNRAISVDFQGERLSGTDPVDLQVQVQEKSNRVIDVYRSPSAATANGQGATIGFQGAGGAGAAAYPLVFNG